MSIRNAAKIDKNFSLPTDVGKKDCAYYDAKMLDLYGVQYIDGLYRRMPYETAKRVSEATALISTESAGGRVRFVTDSPYIAISVKYRSVSKVPNYSFTATLGFDLYSNHCYVGSFVPPFETTDRLESVIEVASKDDLREYTINFPVCSEVESLFIGVQKGCRIEKAPKYSIEPPIVLYGSSVTQGACASRPGNTYANILSRTLDCDYINLGFWGNALGEEEMAKYIAELPMSAFIYDYDYNAPSAEHLATTHERMFRIIRERNPQLPIVILSAPIYRAEKEFEKRLAVIKQTYQNALNRGGDQFLKYNLQARKTTPQIVFLIFGNSQTYLQVDRSEEHTSELQSLG